MKKLGKRNYALIKSAVKMSGNFNPNENLPIIMENLQCNQVEEIVSFLTWVYNNNKTFGSGNYEQIFSEYKHS
jgi:hypothetical protein